MSAAPGSFPWLLAHEARLVARSFPGGEGGNFLVRNRSPIFWGAALALVLHGVAVPFAKTLRAVPSDPDPAQLMALSFYILAGFAILVARGLDSITQLLYSRADLDLLLSSPLSHRRIFSARLVAVAVQWPVVGVECCL